MLKIKSYVSPLIFLILFRVNVQPVITPVWYRSLVIWKALQLDRYNLRDGWTQSPACRRGKRPSLTRIQTASRFQSGALTTTPLGHQAVHYHYRKKK